MHTIILKRLTIQQMDRNNKKPAVIRFVGETMTMYVTCDDTTRPSRAYRNGAVLKGWKATRDDNNSLHKMQNTEKIGGFKREVDNVYWP